jgi:hypothetical protein
VVVVVDVDVVDEDVEVDVEVVDANEQPVQVVQYSSGIWSHGLGSHEVWQQ